MTTTLNLVVIFVVLWVYCYEPLFGATEAEVPKNAKAGATFRAGKGPIGPPRPPGTRLEEDEYLDDYDESGSNAPHKRSTRKSKKDDEAARKLTARPPGFGPRQPTAITTGQSKEVIAEPQPAITQNAVSAGPPGIQPPLSFQLAQERVLTTSDAPTVDAASESTTSPASRRPSTLMPVPPSTTPPAIARRFTGRLNFVQPDQPFLVGRNVIVRSGKKISTLRGKFAILPSLSSNDVVSNVALNPPAHPPGFIRNSPLRSHAASFEEPLSSFEQASNAVEEDSDLLLSHQKPVGNSIESDFPNKFSPDNTEQSAPTTTPNSKTSFFMNHRGAFDIVGSPVRQLNVLKGASKPPLVSSVTGSVPTTGKPKPLSDSGDVSTKPIPTFVDSTTQQATSEGLESSTFTADNLTRTSAPQIDDRILPNGVLSFREDGQSRTFRVGHNIIRVSLNGAENSTEVPTTSTDASTKRAMLPPGSKAVRPTMTKSPERPKSDTSEFSESPFSDDGERSAKLKLVAAKKSKHKEKIVETVARDGEADKIRTTPSGGRRIVPSSERHRSRGYHGSHYARQRSRHPFTGKAPARSEPEPVRPPGSRPLSSEDPNLPIQTTTTVRTTPELTTVTDRPTPLVLFERSSKAPKAVSSLVVDSPSEYEPSPLIDELASAPAVDSASPYDEPSAPLTEESEMSTTHMDEHKRFRIDVSRMRKILDAYLPKSAPSSLRGASSAVTHGFAGHEAFSEVQRNKLIDNILSAIESVQKFSASVRREMIRVLRDSFIPNKPKGRRAATRASTLRKAQLSGRKSVESPSEATTSSSPTRSPRERKQTRPIRARKAVSSTVITRGITTSSVPSSRAPLKVNSLNYVKTNNDGVFLAMGKVRKVSATARFVRPDELRTLRQ